jgi:hypothetical protein
VDQGQVELLEAQLVQAVLQARDQLVAGQVLGPDLGGDEDVRAPRRRLQRLADLGLVAVDLGGVDVAVAEFEAVATESMACWPCRRKVPRPSWGMCMISCFEKLNEFNG